MKNELYIILQCKKCKLKDCLPLAQYQSYEHYTCPYSTDEGKRCYGELTHLRTTELQFAQDKQPTFNF